MEALSQLDIQNPDHVSVITRDSKVTISVMKDGTSVTLGFPLGSPQPPLGQPAPQMKAVIGARADQGTSQEAIKRYPKRSFRNWDGPSKLNPQSVKEIKMILKDENLRRSCGTVTNFYNVIGKKFGVTGCSISNIARGIAWRDVN